MRSIGRWPAAGVSALAFALALTVGCATNNQTVTPGGTLAMNDTGVSQDACQGATLTLTLKSN